MFTRIVWSHYALFFIVSLSLSSSLFSLLLNFRSIFKWKMRQFFFFFFCYVRLYCLVFVLMFINVSCVKIVEHSLQFHFWLTWLGFKVLLLVVTRRYMLIWFFLCIWLLFVVWPVLSSEDSILPVYCIDCFSLHCGKNLI